MADRRASPENRAPLSTGPGRARYLFGRFFADRLCSARIWMGKRLLSDDEPSGWLASLLIHVVALLTLSAVTLSHPLRSRGRQIIAVMTDSTIEPITDAVFEMPPDSANHFDKHSFDTAHSALTASALEAPSVDVTIASHVTSPVTSALTNDATHSLPAMSAAPIKELMKEVRRASGPVSPLSASKGISAAASGAEAAQGIMASLAKDIEEGPVFVVWLLDGSISLLEDRKNLANALQPFYQQYKAGPKEKPQLLSAVVAFGERPIQVQDTTHFGERSLIAIQNLPIDESGIERVMSAIEYAVRRYSTRARGRLRIIVWTDESGDDTELLEPAIGLCRKSHTVVHVVGPSSVFGSNRGLQPYTDATTGYRFMLPVMRGPDTCLPERLMLPYWFDSAADVGQWNGVMVADGAPWYGGALRERLLAGIGPYSLTRLALETGGTFTMLDRPGETQPFDLTAMKNYFPDYGSARDIAEEINKSAFRSAINKAVQMTYQPINLAPPKMHFFTVRDLYYPFRESLPFYMPPAQFRQQLIQDLAEQAALVTTSLRLIEQSLAAFGENDWGYEYASEPSLRWRAWHDLTRGRLLAMGIRHKEYLALSAQLTKPGALDPAVNALSLAPSATTLVNDARTQSMRETAVTLLRRCAERNPGTPWELLANWELENDFGITAIPGVIPPPQPIVGATPVPPPAPPPQITLPKL